MSSTSTELQINAKSLTLLGEGGILADSSYVIPVYQRPYAWGSEQIRRFLQSLIVNFRSGDPTFLGTLLMMPRKDKEIDIVDGQQRLTTIILFCKYLSLEYPKALLPQAFQTRDWLRSEINGGKENKSFQETLEIPAIPEDDPKDGLNRYAKRLYLIAESFRSLWDSGSFEDIDASCAHLEVFVQYLADSVYFVVIKTHEDLGLAKTLDIFNTINTTGMGLNGGDIFKVRMYDYLDRNGQHEHPMEAIDKLYEDIEEKNKKSGKRIFEINDLLYIYKFILIEGHQLTRQNHQYSASKFFDRVFRSVLLKEHVKGLEGNKLKNAIRLDELESLLAARFEWNKYSKDHLRTKNFHDLIWSRTRYGRFSILTYIYLFRFKDSSFDDLQFGKFVELLAKYYMIQSLKYKRIVNSAFTFTFDLIRKMLSPTTTPDSLIGKLKSGVVALDRKEFRSWHLENEIYGNWTWQNLACTVSLITLDAKRLDSESLWNVYSGDFDVEHIQAKNPRSKPELWDQWEPCLNKLGNLSYLESTLNRSGTVSNRPYSKKKIVYLQKSKIPTIKNLVSKYPDWSLESFHKRQKEEADRIEAFLFETG